MADVPIRELLDVAADAAYAAGRRTLAWFNTGVAIDTKSDDTPVTVADREAEQIVRDRLAKAFPTHMIVGEEHGTGGGPDADYRWYVDPIDGTKSFIHGIPLYSVLVGCLVRGRCVAGVIYLPALDEMVCAGDGLGCWWNGRRARVSEVARLEDSTLLTTDVPLARKRSDAFDRLEAKAKLSRGAYDAYGYALVATGRAEIVVDPVMNAWDCGPLPVILREAGGRFSSWAGEETIDGGDAIATNAALYEQAMAVIRTERRR